MWCHPHRRGVEHLTRGLGQARVDLDTGEPLDFRFCRDTRRNVPMPEPI